MQAICLIERLTTCFACLVLGYRRHGGYDGDVDVEVTSTVSIGDVQDTVTATVEDKRSTDGEGDVKDAASIHKGDVVDAATVGERRTSDDANVLDAATVGERRQSTTTGSSTSCDTDAASRRRYKYVNFLRLAPSEDAVKVTLFTATKARADSYCSTDTCKATYAPPPAGWMTLFADGAMLRFLHPTTGDWWQCDTGADLPRFVLGNGLVTGKTAGPTAFFALAQVGSKFFVSGGGFVQGAGWSHSVPPTGTDDPAISNSMELDLENAVWTDADTRKKALASGSSGPPQYKEVACGADIQCYPKEFCLRDATYDYMTMQVTFKETGTCTMCEWYVYSDQTCTKWYNDNKDWYSSLDLIDCIAQCETKSTSLVSEATLRYGHGLANWGEHKLVFFGGTWGNVNNRARTAYKDSKKNETENRELVLGSFTGIANALNDLWVLEYQNKTYTQVMVTIGTPPEPRSFFGFVARPGVSGGPGNEFILFGGFTLKRLPELSDLWRLTMSTNANDEVTATWQPVVVDGASPSGRAGHGVTTAQDGTMHLFGGGKTYQYCVM